MNWITNLQSSLGSALENPDVFRVLFVSVLAIIAFVFALAVSFAVGGFWDPVKRRVGLVTDTGKSSSTARVAGAVVDQLGTVMVPKDQVKRSTLATKLLQAGYRAPSALRQFFAAKLLSLLLTPILILVAVTTTHLGSLNIALLLALMGIGIGWILPDVWLARKVRQRQARLRRGLPDALDLMVVCTEAGLGLNAAIQRVGEEIELQHPDLADEFSLVMMQTRAGIDNRSALKELEHRTGRAEIKAFVATLVQAMRFGTSIAESLRIFAEEMRDKRLQAVQEQAAKLGVKMLFPVAFCMMPAFLLIAIGPAFIRLMRAFSALSGG